MIMVDIRTHSGGDKVIARVVLPDGARSEQSEQVIEPDGQATFIIEDDEVIEVERAD